MNGNCIHASQLLGKIDTPGTKKMQRRFAVAVSGKHGLRHRCTQLAKIVDFSIGDQGGGACEKRLVATRKIDDRKPCMGKCGLADHHAANPIRPAMGQGPRHHRQHRGIGRCCRRREGQAGNAAHQGFSTCCRKARHRLMTACSENISS
jgi:hypothetical protein